MKEIDIQNSIRLILSQNNCICFRANVGNFKLHDGRFFNTGLPKGFSDLFGYRKLDGKMFFIEVKNEQGKVSIEQLNFIKKMKEYGALAGIARSPEEALSIVNEA